MEEKNRIRGKRARVSGLRFEVKVRKDLESKGWIVSRWMNQVIFDEETGKLIPAKSFMGRSRNNGFPDFIIFSPSNSVRPKIIGCEVKSNGYLTKEEKEKCKWLLDNKIFSKIFIAKKDKKRGEIVYKEWN